MEFEQETLTQIAQWAMWGVAMAAVMGWLASQRMKQDKQGPPGRLRHPVGVLVVGAVCALFFSALAVASIVFDNGTGGWGVASVFIAFALAGGLMILEYLRVRHECTSNGLTYAKLFGSGGFMSWHNVSMIRYIDSMKWFRLTANTGEIARISAMQSGLPHFAKLVLEHAPRAAIDDDTRVVLEETAAGNLPSIWT